MNMKKSFAVIMFAAMVFSSQIAVPMSVSAADTVTGVTTAPAVTTTTTSFETDADTTTVTKAVITAEATTFKASSTTSAVTTFKSDTENVTEAATTTAKADNAVTTTVVTSSKEKLPRVKLEYKGVEVSEAYEDIIVLEDGKKLFVSCGEKVKFKDMFKKGNKLDINGEFAYNKEQDIYYNCTAEIAITSCTVTEDKKTVNEKLGKLPHTELEYWCTYVIEADKDSLLLQNGMKINVSSGKQHYTDMFKPGNWISLVGEFAYNAENDTYFNVDSKIWLHQYVDVYTFYSDEEYENFVETTTFVEDVTTVPTTTTTALALDEIYYTQPEGKYPIHYEQRVQYKIDKQITVDKIKNYGVYDESGTKWMFDSRSFDVYELGKGDVIRVFGLFDYGFSGDEFYGTDGGFEVISYNDNYEQYASIPILEEFEHRITDKRLSYYDDIEYKVEFEDVTVADVLDYETIVLSNGYKMAFCVNTCPDLAYVHIGDHINVTGWFTYMDDADILCTNYHDYDAENCGKFRIISRDIDAVRKEAAKPATPGVNNLINIQDAKVTAIDGDLFTLDNGEKYSFYKAVCPDMEYIKVDDSIDIEGKFRYNWVKEIFEGTTQATFKISSRKINVIPDDKQKKNITLENKEIKINTYRNGVITDNNGVKYYIAQCHENDFYNIKAGDTVTVNGKFDYWNDDKIYVSYTADIKLGAPVKLSDKAGDSNVDGDTNLADSVLIMQTIANPEKYILSDQGRKNADIEGNHDGVTAKDALKIQRITLKLEK